MTLQDIENIVFIIMFSLLSIFILGTIILCIYSNRMSKKYEEDYRRAIQKLLLEKKKNKKIEIKKAIQNLYSGYKSKSSFSYLSFNELNTRLVLEMRGMSASKKDTNQSINEVDIQFFESTIKEIDDDFSFSDEKSTAILKKIEDSLLSEPEKKSLREQIMLYFTSILSYCDGRVFEKETQLSTLQYEVQKLKKKKIIKTIIGGIFSAIGLLSSVVTLVSFFKK